MYCAIKILNRNCSLVGTDSIVLKLVQIILCFPHEFWKMFHFYFFLQTFGFSVDEVELIILYLSFHQSALLDLSYLVCDFMKTSMSEP